MKKKKATKKKVAKKKLARKAVRRPARRAKKTAKRRPASKVAKKKTKKVARRSVKRGGSSIAKPVGVVTHFYTHIKVAIVRFSRPVRTGTVIRFAGATTNFTQRIDSMQYDHKPVALAPKGKQVGIRVGKRVREGDKAYLAD